MGGSHSSARKIVFSTFFYALIMHAFAFDIFTPENPISTENVTLEVTSRHARSSTSPEMPEYLSVTITAKHMQIKTRLRKKDVVGYLSSENHVYNRDWATYVSDDTSGIFVVRRHEHKPVGFSIEGYMVHEKAPCLLQSNAIHGYHVVHKLSTPPSVSNKARSIVRRAAPTPTTDPPTADMVVKLKIFVDPRMYRQVSKRVGSSLAVAYIEEYYVMLIMFMDQAMGSLREMGTMLTCQGVGLEILQKEVQGAPELPHRKSVLDANKLTVKAAELLYIFRKYKGTKEDVAVLLTGYDLLDDDNHPALRGLSYTFCACTIMGVAIVEFEFDPRSPQYVTHEVGHSLGARHDGEEEHPLAKACRPCDNFIMSPVSLTPYTLGGKAENWWKFSSCSNAMIRRFVLRMHKDNCLKASPDNKPVKMSGLYWSKISRDFQCQIITGHAKSSFLANYEDESTLCKDGLRCRVWKWLLPVTYTYVPPVGTPCGLNKTSGVCDICSSYVDIWNQWREWKQVNCLPRLVVCGQTVRQQASTQPSPF